MFKQLQTLGYGNTSWTNQKLNWSYTTTDINDEYNLLIDIILFFTSVELLMQWH